MHVVRGDADDAGADGDLGERVVARRVERVTVIPQLDRDAVTAERVDEALQLALGCGRAALDERGAAPHPCDSR